MKYSAILVILITIILSASFASALTVSGSNYANLCQCEQVKQKMSVCSVVPGMYSVSADSVEGKWFSFAPNVIDLTKNSCADIYLFITPDCYAFSGDYKIPLNFRGPENLVKEYNLVVRQCHTADLNIISPSFSINPCESAKTKFVLKNKGAFTDEFVLLQKGLMENWAVYPQEKIVLAPFSSFEGTLELNPFCNAEPKNYPFQLIAANTMTNFGISKNISLSVLGGAPFTIGKLLGESSKYTKTLCEESDSEELFEVKSVSMRPDTISLSLLDANKSQLSQQLAALDKNIVLIDKNKSENITLSIKKSNGIKTGFIRAYSKEFDRNFDIPFEFKFENCFDATIERKSTEISQCFGKRSEEFIVKNTGTNQSTVDVSLFIDGKLVESKSLVLLKGESRSVSFIVSPNSAGSSDILARISSQSFSKDLNYKFNFENCYDLTADVSNLGTCSNLSIDYVFDVENKGTRTQVVSLSIDAPWLNISPGPFVIDANSKKAVSVKGFVPSNFSKTYKITAKSAQQEVEQSISISDLGVEKCNDFIASLSKYEIDANCCSGKLVDLDVSNTGFFNSVYTLKKAFPSWVSLSEDSFSLTPKESKRVFVYASPDANTEGVLNAKIVVVNDKNVSKELLLKINASPAKQFVDSNKILLSLNAIDINYAAGLAEIEIVVKNDSNSGFNLNNILVKDLNAVLDLNKNTYLAPGVSLAGKLFIPHDYNSSVHDANAVFVIVTSAGNFSKSKSFSLMPAGKGLTLTGFFSAYSIPFVEVLLVVLLVLVLLAIRSRLSKRKGKGSEGNAAGPAVDLKNSDSEPKTSSYLKKNSPNQKKTSQKEKIESKETEKVSVKTELPAKAS